MKTIIVVFCLLFPLSVYAQEEDPPTFRWVRYYQAQEFARDPCLFNDVFAPVDGGFVCSGKVHTERNHDRGWLLVLNENGDRIYDLTFNYEENNVSFTHGYSVIKTDDGGYLMGGRTQVGAVIQLNFDVMKINQDGEPQWWEVYSDGNSGWGCHALIELKEGNYVASGQNTGWNAYAVMLNADGNIIWENEYEGSWFFAIREVENEGLVFAGYSPVGALLIKTDYEGDVIWRRTYEGGSLWNLISLPNGGFAATGQATFRRGFFLIRVDDEGQLLWSRNYALYERGAMAVGLAAMPDGGMVMSGYTSDARSDVSAIVRVDAAGNLRWRRINDSLPNEPLDNGVAREYGQVIVQPDGSIVLCGSSGRYDVENEPLSEGVLVCLEADRSPPHIVEYSPETLELNVLLDDTVSFWVRASDAQNDILSYLWIHNQDTISTDTATIIQFEVLGDDTVQCCVSDGESEESIQWLVHVRDFYIVAFQPDSLELMVRRNQEIDFSVTVRAVDDDPPIEYFWLFDGDWLLDEDDNIVDDDSVSIRFNRGRDHTVEAVASRGENVDHVIWQVLIQDLVVDWWPEPLEMRVPVDTVMQFVVDLFDPEADSLSILWTLDGDSVSSDFDVFLEFDEIGQHQIIAYAADTVDNDTLIWNVLVVDHDAVDKMGHHIPDQITLYPPAPNPFNSQTTVRYALPTAGQVRLDLYDITGRLVTTMVNRYLTVGEHSTVINGNDMTSGIYIVRMVADGETYTRKIFLVK
ncbi:MAG: T9SS type A sorting domain-containing protein [Candidatus Electryoneaceae bacterium]|nr:T9SS type A sorting domain-containing protein [Candidatus Electryoneaceae bacterium]